MSVELKALIFGIVSLVCYIITGVSCRKYKDKYKTYSADEINTYFTFAKYLFIIFAYAGLLISLVAMIFNM